MDENQAMFLAEALGGEAWNSGGDIWLVLFHRSDGRLALKKQGVVIERQMKAFMVNIAIANLLQEQGKKVLPITVVNGEVFKTGEYPLYEDLCKELGIEPLTKGKPMTLHMG